ncbi:phytanoyl-CoA dioxygenase family protein [Alteribacillus sp. HJP-4]|uniref:phytanoyl-CoA dioxygenase family protein n=1 Tax=Alteribacillus sp. HJP-4 TaxID=2775394 RepID=UPI0035CCD8CC
MISKEEVQHFAENGYLHVRAVFSEQEVEDMRNGVDRIVNKAAQSRYDRNHAWEGDYLEEKELKKLVLKGFHDVHYQEAAFTRAMVHPNMTSVLQQLIGPNVELHHSKMLVKPPENGAAFPMHQDHPYFPHEKHTMLAASVHLDDADKENGCLHVVPGSHKKGPIPHIGQHYLDQKEYSIEEGTPCPAKAGDVVFFNYLTIHGSLPNYSSRTRRNVLYQFRDPSDLPVKQSHVNWGQGLMVSGEKPDYQEYKPEKILQTR